MIKVIKFLFLTLLFVVPIAGFITTPNDHVIKGENRTVNQFPKFSFKDKLYLIFLRKSNFVLLKTHNLFGKVFIFPKYLKCRIII